MNSSSFFALVQKLEEDCLNFDMTESDYSSLLDYLVSIKNIRHLKKRYYGQDMSVFELFGIEVKYINPNMALVCEINNPDIKIIQAGDVIVNVDNKADFLGKLDIGRQCIKVHALRRYLQEEMSLVEELLRVPTINRANNEIERKYFEQHSIGIVYLRNCNYPPCEFEEMLDSFVNRHITTLVIDLRDNLGGSVERVSQLLDLLIDKDAVEFYCVNKFDTIMVRKSRSDRTYQFNKVIIIVNYLTRSSAEILASSLKESVGAIIVGGRTGGKGTIISPLPIGEDRYLMYPKYLCLTPHKNCVENVGIEPDYEYDMIKKMLPVEVCEALEL